MQTAIPSGPARGTRRAMGPRMNTTTPSRRQRGALLVEALVALALAGFVAAGGAALAELASRTGRAAERLDLAREAALGVHEQLGAVPFAALPARFGASSTDLARTLDSDRGEVPPEWLAGAAALPAVRMEVALEGLAAGAGAAPCAGALALRVRVRVTWREGAAPRALELTDVRL